MVSCNGSLLFTLTYCAHNSACNVVNSLDETDDRERQTANDPDKRDEKKNEIRHLERLRRTDNDANSTNRNPKNQPTGYRTREVEPKLVELPRASFASMIDTENLRGFEAVE